MVEPNDPVPPVTRTVAPLTSIAIVSSHGLSGQQPLDSIHSDSHRKLRFIRLPSVLPHLLKLADVRLQPFPNDRFQLSGVAGFAGPAGPRARNNICRVSVHCEDHGLSASQRRWNLTRHGNLSDRIRT